MKAPGYSIIEVVGVVAVVLTLAVAAIPSIRNFQDGGKQGAAVRNASTLNSAAQQFDQSGGLLTARVPVPDNVASIKDPTQLPELAVLNLLRGDKNGGQVSAWQEPIFADEGYRVIWVNPVQDKPPVREGLSGDRSLAVESLLASGDGGRFEVIEDTGGRMGIVGFQRGDLVVAALEYESPTPTPAQANRAPSASLSVNPPTAQVGELFTYIANGTDPDNDPLSFTFTHAGGTQAAGANRVFTRSYPAPGTYTVSVQASDGVLTSQAQAAVTVTASPKAPVVSLTGLPVTLHRGEAATFTAQGSDPEGKALAYRFIQDGSIVQQGPSNVFTTTYSTLGSKPVTVVAVDPDGLTGTNTASVTVTNRAPIGSVSANPNPGVRFQPVTLTAAFSDPDNDAFSYSWGAAQTSRTYDAVGRYPESVTVTDAVGDSVTEQVEVVIENQPPSASLTVDRTVGVRGDQFNFTATGADPDGDPIQYSFKLGTDPDATWGEYTDSGSFKQLFDTVGEKTVTARVRDSLRAVKETAPLKVNVINRAPTVTILADKTSGHRGEQFTFTATGSDLDGDALVYSFNGGAFGASNVFRTAFAKLGTQSVNVVARDALSANSTPVTIAVNITNRAPTVALSVNPTSGTTGQQITYTASGSDPDSDPMSYSFNVNGSWTAFGTSNTITTQYSTAGNYVGQVIAKDAPGSQSDTSRVSVSISDSASLTVLANPSTAGTTSGSGTYAIGTTVNPSVSPKSGFMFSGWQNNMGKSNPLSFPLTQSATVVANLVEDPVWDTLVLYRRINQNWDAWADNPNLRDQVLNKGKNLVVNEGLGKNGTGSQSGFMTGTSNTMVNWLLDQGSLYKDLVHQVKTQQQNSGYRISRDAVVVMTRIDPITGERAFQAGIWPDYADPRANSPFQYIHKDGRTHLDVRDGTWGVGAWGRDFKNAGDLLETQWQTTNNKSISVNGQNIKVNVVGYQNYASPIILDLAGTGRPDLLAGADAWKKDRRGAVNVEHTRTFDLDLSGPRSWEWVGPTAGILVWGNSLETPDGSRLFGNHTWERPWEDGYEPLLSLDINNDGKLTGEELNNIYVWVDSNSNATIEDGELKDLNSLDIIEIDARAERDDAGNTSVKKGFSRSDGSSGASWDWWSGQVQSSEDYEAVVYEWGPIDQNSKIPGGEFVFMQYPAGRLEMMSFVPMVELNQDGEAGLFGILFDVQRDGLRMEWRTSNGNLDFISNAIIEDGDIVGVTRTLAKGQEISRYGWVAMPKTLKRLAQQ